MILARADDSFFRYPMMKSICKMRNGIANASRRQKANAVREARMPINVKQSWDTAAGMNESPMFHVATPIPYDKTACHFCIWCKYHKRGDEVDCILLTETFWITDKCILNAIK